MDGNLGAVMSADGQDVRAFLRQEAGGIMQVFSPVAGVQTVLSMPGSFWIAVSEFGTYALAGVNTPTITRYRIHLPTGTVETLPALPEGMQAADITWRWIGEDGSMLATTQGTSGKQVLKLTPDFSTYNGALQPANMPSSANLKATATEGGHVLAGVSLDSSPKTFVVRNGELDVLVPTIQPDGTTDLYLSPGGNWLAGHSFTGSLRRWNLQEPEISEPFYLQILATSSSPATWRVNPDGTVFGGLVPAFYYLSLPYLWLPNGAFMASTDLGLNNLGSGTFTARSVLAVSADRRVLAGNATNTSATHALWVMRRQTAVHKNPKPPDFRVYEGPGLINTDLPLGFSVSSPGESLTRSLTVVNRGEASADSMRFELRGSDAAAFAVESALSAFSLMPQESVLFDITYTAPDSRGHRVELLIHSSAPDSPRVIQLGGGLTPPTVVIESPLGTAINSLEFPTTAIGTTNSREIFVRNTSSSTQLVDPSAVLISYTAPTSPFSLGSALPVTLAPGEAGAFEVDFHPTQTPSAYPATASLYFFPGAGSPSPQPTISLSGLVGPYPHLFVRAPGGTDKKGTVFQGADSIEAYREKSFDFILTNKGLMPLNLSHTQTQTLAGAVSPVVRSKTRLEHGESMIVTMRTLWPAIRFIPYESEVRVFNADEPDGPNREPLATLILTIRSVTPFVPSPVIQVKDETGTPRASGEITVDFGERTAGLALTRQITIGNVSNALSAEWLNVEGFVAEPFRLTPSTIGVRERNEQTMVLRFAPTAAGDFNQDLNLKNNDPRQPDYIVHLKGRGVTGGPPFFLRQPESRIIFLNSTTGMILEPEINGARSMTLTLAKTDGSVLASQQSDNDSGILLSNPEPAHAGELVLKAQNTHGQAQSQPFHLAILKQPTKAAHTRLGGQSLQLSAEASGPAQMTLRWQKDGTWLEDTTRRTGTASNHLSFTDMKEEDSGTYRCEVTVPGRDGLVSQFTPAQTVQVTEKPDIQWPVPMPDGIAGQPSNMNVPTLKSPTKVTITGLPRGVSYHESAQTLSGLHTMAAGHVAGSKPFEITIKATNIAGTTTLKTTWIVRPPHPAPVFELPDQLPDAFAGIPYSFLHEVENHPTAYAVNGLPRGLTPDRFGIVGTPQAPTSAPVKLTVRVSNYSGTTTKTVTLRVRPSLFLGNYEMIIARDHTEDERMALGGRMSLTMTSAGSYTCQFQGVSDVSGRFAGKAILGKTGFQIDQQSPSNSGLPGETYQLKLSADETGIRGTLKLDPYSWRSRFTLIRGTLDVEGVQTTKIQAVNSPLSMQGPHTARVSHIQPQGRQWRQEGGTPTQAPLVIRNSNYGRGTLDQGLNLPAIYGTLGVPSSTTEPGSRVGSFCWTDHDGRLHLFGGTGLWTLLYTAQNVKTGVRADHWVLDPETLLWSWQSGQKTGDHSPRAPVAGLSTENFPGARTSGVSWVDANGDFWLFGGVYSDFGNTLLFYNDLWRFVPRLKAWERVRAHGSASFGMQGVAAESNLPPARSDACGWTDPEGNLWLFGGITDPPGTDTASSPCWNDLWRFDVTSRQWTWISGGSTQNVRSKITAPASPGSRERPAIWPDPATGNVLLFGGTGAPDEGATGGSSNRFLGDLWLWNHATQTWRRLHDKQQGTPSWMAPPYATKDHYRHWRAPDGLCWLQMKDSYLDSYLGGESYVEGLWTYDPAASTWTKYPYGSKTLPGSFTGDVPDSYEGAMWQGHDGRAWFHGGFDYMFLDYLFSHGPARVPETDGWLSLAVSPRGIITWTGMLGDGTAVTGSSGLSVHAEPDGSRSWMLRYAPAGDFMSVQGRMKMTPGAARTFFTGDLTAIENLRPAAKRDRSFRSGWPLHAVTVDGGSYRPPASGSPVLGITKSISANSFLTLTLPGTASPLAIPLNLGTTAGSVSPGSLPSPISKLTVKVTPATGVYSGTATLKNEDTLKPGKYLERTAPLHGVILDADGAGAGLILVPDLPTSFTPASLTPIRAGGQSLTPAAN